MKIARIGARPRTFQDLIFALQRYWSAEGCVVLQPYDMEVGAGTFHTATFLRAIGPEPWAAAYVQPSRRPTDGRYGDNPFRLQHYYQFQVLLKPAPLDILDRYLGSLAALGLDPLVNDVRFVEDNWESPTLGAWGLGWEVWLNGMEITQFTYFQQVGGLDCRPVSGELTYGLERLAMDLQGVESIFDILWTDGPQGRVTYGDVFHQNEAEQSAYNFEHADIAVLFRHFDDHELRGGIGARLPRASLRHGAIESFATPRRLAVRVRRLAAAQPDQEIRRRGPPLKAAYDEAGAPTRAAQAFAASCGVELAALGRERDDKNIEYLWFAGRRAGASVQSLLPGIVAEALEALPIPKRMRWGTSEAQFVRPVHWLVMLYGHEIVPATILDTVAGRSTRGHRFHAPRELLLRAPASYEGALLKRGKVIAGFAGRRERVRVQLLATAAQLGGQALIDAALLEEVTALVEWPVAVAGRYEERFLQLPREVLLATLQDHQRYFAVQSGAAALLPWFITIANIESRDVSVVRAGNERVVRPRLADAALFLDQDLRTPLAARIALLARVSYHAQLGSLGDQGGRIPALAQALASSCGADPGLAVHAAKLCKCDLLTSMVGEFPELQGVMCGYYAAADGEEAEVASAIREHYLPRGAGDLLPATPTGKTLALADRLDTLAGSFAIGQKPSGTPDPFGLRRAAIGLVRLALELKVDFDLRALLE